MDFLDPAHGFVGFRDWIGYTSDSGHTFTRKNITIGNVNYAGNVVNLTFGFWIQGIKAFNQNNLLVYGHYGLEPTILLSNDGGNSFKVVYWRGISLSIPNGGFVDMVFPVNNMVGYAVDLHYVFKTINGGLSWSMVGNFQGSSFTGIKAIDNDNVYLVSTHYASNKILKTTNGGSVWSLVTLPGIPNGLLKDASFLNASHGWIIMENNDHSYNTYNTTNGGGTWALVNNPKATSFNGNHMRFFTDNIGFALGPQVNTVYRTDDGGKIWEPLERDNINSYQFLGHNDLHFYSQSQFWAGGYGFIELTTNGGGTPLPKAFFDIDTIGLASSQTVNLINYSRPTYQYKWYRNDTLVSTSYNFSYIHATYRAVDSIKLVVITGGRTDTIVKLQYFNVPPLPAYPAITSFEPQSGAVGDIITLTGINFTGTTSVSIGGVPAASFSLVSPTSLKVEIGNGSSGSIAITTPVGIASVGYFTYQTRLHISSLVPQSGAVGTSVTISGSNFHPTSDSNIVYFGSVRAVVVSASSNQIIAKVPTGANNQRLTVTTGRRTTYSRLPFVVTFPNGGDLSEANYPGRTTVAANEGAYGILSADFDGDGKTDLTTGATDRDRFGIYRNISDVNTAAFAPVHYIPNPAHWIDFTKMTILDANGDGKLDIVGGSDSQGVTIFLNQSSPGVLNFDTRIAVPASPVNLCAADFNLDGKPDLAAVSNVNRIFLYQNNSSSTDVSFVIAGSIYLPSANDLLEFELADIDGDGREDIIVTGQGSTSEPAIAVYRNISSNGEILFQQSTPYRFPVPAFRPEITIGDIDSDGKPDVISLYDGLISVLRNMSVPGSPAFAPVVSNDVQHISDIQTGDLNGDGKPELCMAVNESFLTTGNDMQAAFIQNNSSVGSIGFGPPKYLGYVPFNHNSLEVAVADIDGDGKMDLSVLNANGSTISVLVYKGGDSTVNICAGTNGVLHTNRNGNIFQWQENKGDGFLNIGDNVNFSGTDSPTLNITNIEAAWHGRKYRCIIDGNQSKEWQIKINQPVTPGVSITATSTSICPGASTTFSASVVNGGTMPSFQWKVNGVNAGANSPTFITSTLANNDQVSVVMTGNALCSQFLTVNSNSIPITVTNGGSVSVLISAPITNTCPGAPITFTAVPTNGGSSPTYQWTVNGINAGTNSNVFTSTTLPNNAQVRVKLTSSVACTSPALSNIIGVTLGSSSSPLVILALPATSFCAGETVTFTALPTNGGSAPVYQWKKNNVNVGTNAPTYTDNALVNGDVLFVVMTSNAPCVSTTVVQSLSHTLNVTSSSPPTVSIAANSSSICPGQGITFVATPTNGGANPAYRWFVNGTDIGATGATFTSALLNNNDEVKVTMTSSANCVTSPSVTSNTIKVTHSGPVTPTVSLSTSTASICPNTPATFNAIPTNGGTSPSYQWQVNGINTGTNSAIFVTAALQNSDQVRVIMTVSGGCVTATTVTSNTIVMNVATVSPSIAIAGTTMLSTGQSSLLNSSISNGGSFPAFQWEDSTAVHPWQTIAGATLASYTYLPAASGDKIRCQLVSNSACAVPNRAVSNVLMFSIIDGPVSGRQVRYYPNPAVSMLILDSLQLADEWQTFEIMTSDGRVVAAPVNLENLTRKEIYVGGLISGQYFGVLRRRNGEVTHFIFVKL